MSVEKSLPARTSYVPAGTRKEERRQEGKLRCHHLITMSIKSTLQNQGEFGKRMPFVTLIQYEPSWLLMAVTPTASLYALGAVGLTIF